MISLQSRIVKAGLKLLQLTGSPVTDKNLAAKRRSFAQFGRLFPTPSYATVTKFSQPGFKAEWVTVPQSKDDTVMLYCHGGGFIFNSMAMHCDLIARIAREAGVKALSVDYSLAPEHPYPTALHEVLAAYKWLLTQNPRKVVLAGDSSGGALVLSLMHLLREQKLPYPACVVVLAPPTDAMLKEADLARAGKLKDIIIDLQSLDYFMDAYFTDTPRNNPISSPYYGSFKDFPPMLVHVDKNELLHLGTVRLVEKAKKEGVQVTYTEVEGLWHVWHLFARYVPEARESIKQIGEFIKAF